MRPIIMSGESIKAILVGRKTQTRRIIKPQPNRVVNGLPYRRLISNGIGDVIKLIKCPYGQIGDRLWVKETWATENRYNHLKPSEIPQPATLYYPANRDYEPFQMGIKRSLLFMPRWASRITLEITGIRVERVQDIPLVDVKKEGISEINWYHYDNAIDAFKKLWDSINAKRGYGWGINPWVWVISFRKLL